MGQFMELMSGSLPLGTPQFAQLLLTQGISILIEKHTWAIGSTTIELLFHSQHFPVRITINSVSEIFENQHSFKRYA